MGDKDSSDEEDVFECGRCKEKFTEMAIFMCHKKEKSCQRVKKQKPSSSDSGIFLEKMLLSDSDVHIISPEKQQEQAATNLSPSISDIFSSKGNSKGVESNAIPIDLLSALEQIHTQVRDPDSVECALCQEWYPCQQSLDNHLQEKHGLVSQADLVQIEKKATLEDPTTQQQISQSVPDTKLANEKPSRRARPNHSCTTCNLKFLSRFKLEQHMTSRKHRNAAKQQEIGKRGVDSPRRPGRRAKKGICSVCKISTNSLKELSKHMKEEHSRYKGKENSRSDETGKSSEQSRNLCRECGSLVPTRSLKRHERRCANRKHFECPLCKHQSRERTDYKAHVNSHKVWIVIEKSKTPWENITPTSKSGSSISKQASDDSAEDKTETLKPKEQQYEGSSVILSPSDLAVLGLMPKQHSGCTTVVECLDALASGLKGVCESGQVGSSKEQDEGGEASDNPSDEMDSSSVKMHPRQLKCKLCVKWFIRRDLDKHMYDKHNMAKQFQCRDLECLETHTDMESFKKHITTHSNKLMFQCGCRQCIPNRREVEADYPEGIRKWKMRQYYSQLSFKCDICWMKFASAGRLMKHQESDTHKHACDKCGKVMVSKRQLRLHKEIHTDQRGYLCDMCGSGFKTDRDLKRHIVSHSSERPFVCSECGKSFIFKNKLNRHCNTVHVVKKQYGCDHPGCKKTYARKDKLKEHFNTHKKTPPYECKYCKKTFCRKDSAREHVILTHTKDYPYSCKVCNKGFLRPKTMEDHQTLEHGKNSNTSSLFKLLKPQSEVQQCREGIPNNAPSSAASAPMSYVIYDQNIASVLQGQSENDAQTLPNLQSMAFTRAPTSGAPSSELTYQMTDITGNAASSLAYHMSNIGIPDSQNTIQVTLTHGLPSADNETA